MAEDITGHVYERGVAVTRTVKLYNSTSHALVNTTTSNNGGSSGQPSTGKYVFPQVSTGNYFILIFDSEDSEKKDSFNILTINNINIT